MKKFVKPELFLVKMCAPQIMANSADLQIDNSGTPDYRRARGGNGGNGNTKIDRDLL